MQAQRGTKVELKQQQKFIVSIQHSQENKIHLSTYPTDPNFQISCLESNFAFSDKEDLRNAVIQCRTNQESSGANEETPLDCDKAEVRVTSKNLG